MIFWPAGRWRAEWLDTTTRETTKRESFQHNGGAKPSSIYTSITKATAAAMHRAATGTLGKGDSGAVQLNLAIEQAAGASGGKFTSLKGGVPLIFGDEVIGAVGVGGAIGEQDVEVAAA